MASDAAVETEAASPDTLSAASAATLVVASDAAVVSAADCAALAFEVASAAAVETAADCAAAAAPYASNTPDFTESFPAPLTSSCAASTDFTRAAPPTRVRI